VRDSGIGIAPADLDRVFEMFTPAKASAIEGSGGLGVGLALSRRLAELDFPVKRLANEEGIEFDPLITPLWAAHVIAVAAVAACRRRRIRPNASRCATLSSCARNASAARYYRRVPVVLPRQGAVPRATMK
jgi:hypothetical protein